MSVIETTVVSSRIRLARNVEGLQFPHKMKDKIKARSLANLVYDSLRPLKEKLTLYYMDEVDKETAEQFKENYLISNTLLKNSEYSALITNPDGSISVMINEEDNIREQYMSRGFAVDKLFERAMDIDDNYIGKRIAYAKSPRFGFLTACLTNLGTGMRASVMLFLPGLVRSGQLKQVARRIIPEGFAIRGAYGEGSQGDGYLYQISNEVTLGVKENDLISRLEDVVRFMCENEASQRHVIKESDIYALRDSCGRAYGILTNAEILPYDEFLKLVSELKLGVALGMYGMKKADLIDDLIVAMRPHNLVIWNNEEDEEEVVPDKDRYRAQCVKKTISSYIYKEK